ncbi:MAG: hypothetical protein AAB288_09360 [Acidobacteriota bacterium]
MGPVCNYLMASTATGRSLPEVDIASLGWSFFWRLLPIYAITGWTIFEWCISERKVSESVPIAYLAIGLGTYLLILGGKKAVTGR